MARRKTLPDLVRSKCALAERLTALRAELYGDRGGPELARRLGLPIRTWYNYEAGVTIPAEVILKIVELTGVEPFWLLHGQGPKYRAAEVNGHSDDLAPPSVKALLQKAIGLLEASGNDGRLRAAHARSRPGKSAGATDTGFVVLGVDRESSGIFDKDPGPPCVVARPEWLEQQCGCVPMVGDAMVPVVADRATVAFSLSAEALDALDGRLVVAWVDGLPIIRWFERHGRYALLRSERTGAEDAQYLIDLETQENIPTIRRVLWVCTTH